MRTSLLFGATLTAALVLAPVRDAQSFEAPHPLSGRDLQVLLLGNTLLGLDQDGAFWIYYPNADTLWGRSSSGDVDVGRWWIENDSYCRAWRRWHDGQTRCWQMARRGIDELLWYSLGGDQEGRSYVRDGNAIGNVAHDDVAVAQLADAGTGLAVVARAVTELDGWVSSRRRVAEREPSEIKDRFTPPAQSDGSRAGKTTPLWPANLSVERSDSPGGAAAAARGATAVREAAAREAAAREAAAREAAAREAAAREAAAREAAAREAARKAAEKQSSRSKSGGSSGVGDRGSKSGSDRDHG